MKVTAQLRATTVTATACGELVLAESAVYRAKYARCSRATATAAAAAAAGAVATCGRW